jgi:hypothetical protein
MQEIQRGIELEKLRLTFINLSKAVFRLGMPERGSNLLESDYSIDNRLQPIYIDRADNTFLIDGLRSQNDVDASDFASTPAPNKPRLNWFSSSLVHGV